MRVPLLWVLIAVLAILVLVAFGRPVRQPAQQTDVSAGGEPKPPAAEPTPLPVTGPLPTDPHPLPDVLIDPHVRIEKSLRRLTVFSDEAPVKSYRVALGGAPEGDKEREGDLRTPEGEFYVCSRNPESKYHLALGLSYPNEEDADRGLASGSITKREHRSIVTAIRRLQRPPWKTALGGEIMIHGAGAARGDWTLGCIAVDDDDIEELFTALPLGTPVEIVP